MSKFDIDLARAIRRQLVARDPKGEFDLAEAKALYVQRMDASDLASLKMTSADAAFAALDLQQPHLVGQLALPGLPPDEEEYIPTGPNKRARAFTADAEQVLNWIRYAESQANKVNDRVRNIKKRTDPILIDYMIPRRMTWGVAAQAYAKDHPADPDPSFDPDADPDGEYSA